MNQHVNLGLLPDHHLLVGTPTALDQPQTYSWYERYGDTLLSQNPCSAWYVSSAWRESRAIWVGWGWGYVLFQHSLRIFCNSCVLAASSLTHVCSCAPVVFAVSEVHAAVRARAQRPVRQPQYVRGGCLIEVRLIQDGVLHTGQQAASRPASAGAWVLVGVALHPLVHHEAVDVGRVRECTG